MAHPKLLFNLNEPISAYAFNADRTQVALSPSTHEVHIYDCKSSPFRLLHVLSEHNQYVSGIDWAPKSNRIVTCSHDRNAYVWTWDGNAWVPSLVLLRLIRAATYVTWSPNEQKFAVASSAKTISISYFDQEHDWWISKHLKKPIHSTVAHLAWHPNSILIAAAGMDQSTRVFSAFIKGVDEKPTLSSFWGDKLPFGTVCADLSTCSSGWVHGVSFSPSGNVLGFVTHDSSFNVYYPDQKELISIRLPILPLLQLLWLDESTVIAVGHETSPIMFSGGPTGWKMLGLLDQGNAPKVEAGLSALAMFKAMDTKAAANVDNQLSTIHQCTIRSIQKYSETQFTTSGTDGRIVLWDSLNEAIKKMKI
ncbi:hypothetical protein HMI54_004198 [Coelomomyces lativittatus]|nr:hypothetical protein HMI56_001009 [Coelomomyces lativittatus]KAJ1517768.1 hypothetical protein HMI54_004198 [Coelomomyces lativittatus]KAJ1518432.1 hypothetical protein HMI55_002049 [Coelomomyces lativittatus]